MSSELYIGRVTTRLLRVRLARALHAADCGCEDFGDPTTDEDDRYIKSADEALASLDAAGALPANSDEVSEPTVKFTWNLLSHATRIEECWELLAEVKALEYTEQVLRDTIAIQKDLVRIQAGIIDKRDATIAALRAELELERSRYTLGGIPPKPNAPHWVNVAAPRVSSADDPTAPPLRRSDTSSSFQGGESRG